MSSEIAIEEAGPNAPWLVLVHGMSQSHAVFDRQVAAFKSRYRILLVDLPGHGRAADHAGPFGHMEFADAVEAALRRHDVADAHYWGTHTGAAAGLLIASRQRGRFRSLVCEGPVMPGRSLPVVAREIARAGEIARAAGLGRAIEAWWENSCWFDHMRRNPRACRSREHHAIVATFGGRPWTEAGQPKPVPDISSALAALSLPVLIYNGEHDHAEFLAEAARLAQMMPTAQRTTIANAGGFPAWEQPDLVNRLVGAFLSR